MVATTIRTKGPHTMPSTSPKQARFMAAAAHNPEFAKKAGIRQSVAKDFNEHDKKHLVKALRSPKTSGSISSESSAIGSASA